MKICIGVGHGGTDPGACNGARREADDNLRLAVRLREKLSELGHTAALTRSADVSMTPEQRAQLAAAASADLFIDLHRNSHTDPEANGTEIWVKGSCNVPAASAVLESLARVSNQKIRGVKIGAYRVLQGLSMPAMLLELGFISNRRDNELFDRHFDALAAAIAAGILSALGQPCEQPAEAGKTSLYRVQVGAFAKRENAEIFLETVHGMGLEAFLVAPDTAREDE